MITPEEKELIIKYLGKHFSRKIIPVLNYKSILNEKQKSYSPKSIQNIINGITENTKVETAIFQLVADCKEKQEKLQNLKKQVL